VGLNHMHKYLCKVNANHCDKTNEHPMIIRDTSGKLIILPLSCCLSIDLLIAFVEAASELCLARCTMMSQNVQTRHSFIRKYERKIP